MDIVEPGSSHDAIISKLDEELKRVANRKSEEKAKRELESRLRIERLNQIEEQAKEAKRKAEEEAKRKAAEWVRLKDVEEAKQKAEVEAKLKADEWAKVNAEAEEVRMKAEDEVRKTKEAAKLRSKEEANRKAAEEARLQKLNRRIEELIREKEKEKESCKMTEEKLNYTVRIQILKIFSLLDLVFIFISCTYLVWYFYGKRMGFDDTYLKNVLNLFIWSFLYIVLMFVAKKPKDDEDRLFTTPLPYAILCGTLLSWLTRGWNPFFHYLIMFLGVFIALFIIFCICSSNVKCEFFITLLSSCLTYAFWLETLVLFIIKRDAMFSLGWEGARFVFVNNWFILVSGGLLIAWIVTFKTNRKINLLDRKNSVKS